jgi:leader peptidase (prepilin peptidase)/N-methyltransferase
MLQRILFKVVFVAFSLALAIADIKTGEVPRAAFIAAFPFFFSLRVLEEGFPPVDSIVGLALGFFIFLLIFFISEGKLGLADVWYSALMGLALGPYGWYVASGFASVCGMAFLFLSRRRVIPFIPFMALGSAVMGFVRGWF